MGSPSIKGSLGSIQLGLIEVDQFLVESRLHQWNSVRVLPSLPMQQGLEELQAQTPLF